MAPNLLGTPRNLAGRPGVTLPSEHVARRRVLVTSVVAAALTLLLAAVLLLTGTAAARADSGSAGEDQVRHLAVDLVIEDSGDVLVTETYRWDFGSREGRGFARDLNVLFDYPAGGYREYQYSDFEAGSPSGAPSDVVVIDHGGSLEVQVAAPEDSDVRVTGVQTYVLSYRIAGALNRIEGDPDAPDGEELFWNITGDSHVAMDQVDVTVTAPVPAERVRCTQSADGAPCDPISPPGAVVTASATDLPADTDLTLAVGYPLGTFANTDPILVPEEIDDDWMAESQKSADGVRSTIKGSLIGAGALIVVLGGGIGGSTLALRRKRRDLAYAGIPPGVIPAPGSGTPVAVVTHEPPVAVRFTPPDDLSVAEVGAIHTKTLRSRDATATIIDLAVRGYLRIEEIPRKSGRPANDWTLVATPPAQSDLLGYETTLLQALFRKRTTVRMSDLRDEFAARLGAVLGEVGSEIHARRLVTQKLGQEGGSFASFKQRTALGRAYYEQSRGFEKYLSVAEANQLRFEEGQDVFSRYLPYAIVYDLADRWAAIFARLEAQGIAVQRPTWYWSTSDTFAFGAFATTINRFSETSSSTLSSTPSAPSHSTTGSSGGSGFSGGGSSFSGGGGGGGGSHGL
ncbi:Predicted membrane protein [Sanguibacter gelidistatuariae]|uniref:Predicted membrane protein n=1 Tax=Sanguibacter gelidistatuariae TaxID=1814289 RepID=A0A1G6US45_9MICO|nr:DUF2207 domain-containing protein [Sanguibacter gelidistatuariae]SDD44250.1 Predicted membrane protein [Sanguibacter gelidistatuariae]